ncbi:hypothetical protein N5079_22785 [Planotetraspora sp. A-T 1434]|uniref:hypothetical protein n=1 Tax=Planotetraspora sp. A-T 1434 TaxID=2979219 RepID=UPI0021C118A1|nr:hypothetical protein [Planotetraspora sp. A-T 1434]MCT9933039.1 hypothetical protein [Planotetraspora sp. A-T 1434]
MWRKGGAVDVIVWQTPTARLLPRLLDGRRTGPVFLTDRRARVALPPADVDPGSCRARLSYRRAAELFEQATAELTGGPWTRCTKLRHSALAHAGRTAEYHRKQIREALGFRPSTVADEKVLAEWLAVEVCPVELVEDRQRGPIARGRRRSVYVGRAGWNSGCPAGRYTCTPAPLASV